VMQDSTSSRSNNRPRTVPSANGDPRTRQYYGTPDTWAWQHPPTLHVSPAVLLMRRLHKRALCTPREDGERGDCGLCEPRVIGRICSRCIVTLGLMTKSDKLRLHRYFEQLREHKRARLLHAYCLRRRRRPISVLTAYRRARGLTQRELAREWGFTQQHLSAIERGKKALPPQYQATINAWQAKNESRDERKYTRSRAYALDRLYSSDSRTKNQQLTEANRAGLRPPSSLQ
jgi:transcriptional regulator with XRE-family HTH domain